LNLVSAADRLERIRNLVEIRLNKLIFGTRSFNAMTYGELLRDSLDTVLHCLLTTKEESEEALLKIRHEFDKLAAKKDNLPYPIYYNADSSLALICYALTRHLKPEIVLETGVGYGITSAMVVQAMERNESGTLMSIDFPPLSDPTGIYTGMAIPGHFKKRWQLSLGSSRQQLPKVIKNIDKIGLFISDSANVYTIQQYEFKAVWGALAPGGVMVFNNIGHKFQRFLKSVDKSDFYSVWQLEKPLCVTGILLKNGYCNDKLG
jgi:hypothetical protein